MRRAEAREEDTDSRTHPPDPARLCNMQLALSDKARAVRIPMVFAGDPNISILQLGAEFPEDLGSLDAISATELDISTAYSEKRALAGQAARVVLNHRECFGDDFAAAASRTGNRSVRRPGRHEHRPRPLSAQIARLMETVHGMQVTLEYYVRQGPLGGALTQRLRTGTLNGHPRAASFRGSVRLDAGSGGGHGCGVRGAGTEAGTASG